MSLTGANGEPVYLQLVLEDGSHCYVSRWYPESFSTYDIVYAIQRCSEAMIRNYTNDRDKIGPWDPAAWKEQHDALSK